MGVWSLTEEAPKAFRSWASSVVLHGDDLEVRVDAALTIGEEHKTVRGVRTAEIRPFAPPLF